MQEQLTEIKKEGKPIEICMYWFDNSMNHKLDDWGIIYRTITRKEMKKRNIEDFKSLKSVVEGYPGMNKFRTIRELSKQDNYE